MGKPLDEAMARYARGDDDAFAEIYDLASPALYGFLLRLCRNEAQAEDLTHDTFMKMHLARGIFKPGAEALPWAYTIARNLFLDSTRSKKRALVSLESEREDRGSDPGIPSPEAGADEMLEAGRLERKIEEVLAGLPESQATAFRLLKQEGLSVAAAAAVLGATEAAVKLRAHRAYEALRAALGDTVGAAERSTRRSP